MEKSGPTAAARVPIPGLNSVEAILQLQRLVGNHALARMLSARGGFPVERPRLPDSSPSREDLVIQRSIAGDLTAAQRTEISQKAQMCWDGVVYCLYLAGQINRYSYDHWGNTPAAALTKLINLGDTRPNAASDIPADCIVGVFRPSGPASWTISHVMISIGGGECYGMNNGCIHGKADWSTVDLADLFTWNGAAPPTLKGEASHPEREIRYCPVSARVAGLRQDEPAAPKRGPLSALKHFLHIGKS